MVLSFTVHEPIRIDIKQFDRPAGRSDSGWEAQDTTSPDVQKCRQNWIQNQNISFLRRLKRRIGKEMQSEKNGSTAAVLF